MNIEIKFPDEISKRNDFQSEWGCFEQILKIQAMNGRVVRGLGNYLETDRFKYAFEMEVNNFTGDWDIYIFHFVAKKSIIDSLIDSVEL